MIWSSIEANQLNPNLVLGESSENKYPKVTKTKL
jgi:hypothetical protein